MLSVSQGTSAMLGFLRWSRVVLAIQFGSCYRPFPLIRRARPRMVISSKLLHATLYCKLCSDSPDKGVRASWTVFISVSEMPAALLSINVLWRIRESNSSADHHAKVVRLPGAFPILDLRCQDT